MTGCVCVWVWGGGGGGVPPKLCPVLSGGVCREVFGGGESEIGVGGGGGKGWKWGRVGGMRVQGGREVG